jgi:hypothetical protein
MDLQAAQSAKEDSHSMMTTRGYSKISSHKPERLAALTSRQHSAREAADHSKLDRGVRAVVEDTMLATLCLS